MNRKAFILPLLMAALFLVVGCKGGNKAPVEDGQAEAAEAAEAPDATPVGPAYDLEAIAKTIAGCDYLENFHNGAAAFRRDGVWMYVDKMGNIVDKPSVEEAEEVPVPDDIRQKYGYVGDFHEGLCWVYSEDDGNDGIGYINEKGELVIPCQYEWAVDHTPRDFHEGLCPVMTLPERELYSYIDKTGAFAFPGYFSSCANFSEGLAFAHEFVMDGDDVKEVRSSYIDKTGKRVIPLEEYCSGGEFRDGIAKVYAYMDQQARMIDKQGNKLFDLDPERFYLAEDFFFSEGLCAFTSRNDTRGFLDKTGRTTLDY